MKAAFLLLCLTLTAALAVVPNGLGLANVTTIASSTPAGGGGSAPSYANAGGTGNRTGSITITQSSANVFVNPTILIDGSTTGIGAYLNGTPDGEWVRFDFGTSKIIDEAKFYQSNSATHGTWKVQGSSDASSWSDVGSSFTFGGSTLQTITELHGNTADYRYYRFIKISGTTNGGPWTHELEFQIGTP